MSDTCAIELDDVGFNTPGIDILREIDWSIQRGSNVVLLGPNGSGKSTLLKLICGYLWPTSGTITTLGSRLGKANVRELRKRIGLVDPSAIPKFDHRMSALEVVQTGFVGSWTIYFDRPTPQQVEISRTAMGEVGLAGKEQQNFQTLSTGEQRRVLLARAIVGEPEVLILDEVCAGLDLLARETLLATVSRMHDAKPVLTLLHVTHHIEEILPDTTEMLLLAEGRIAACGPPSEVLTSQSISKAFGCEVEVMRKGNRWNWSVTPDLWQGLIS